MKESWKTLETNHSRNMNFFCIPGKLQISYYTKCKKIGINPHKDLQHIIEKRLVELGINTKLDELQKQRDQLDEQIRGLIENTTNPLLLNNKLKKEVEQRANEIKTSIEQEELPTRKWLYYISKALANRYDLEYAEITGLLKESTNTIIPPEWRPRINELIDDVASHANNGLLSEEEIQDTFTEAET